MGLASTLTGWLGCIPAGQNCPCQTESTIRIWLVNKSETNYVAPVLKVCPKGMISEPHFTVDPVPKIAPRQVLLYTTTKIAGDQGDCSQADPNFMLGICGWTYGTCTCGMKQADVRYGGQIGVQFNCGDTVILRWSDDPNDPNAAGSWESEVLPAAGNPEPNAAFMTLP